MRQAPLAFLATVAFSLTSNASQITWTGATDTNWSTATNWNPNTAAPATGDTGILTTTGTNRTVTYGTSASATLGGLVINQTDAAINELNIQRSVTINDAVVLGSTSGTAMISVSPTGGNPSIAFTNGITINSGGKLSLGFTANGTAAYYAPSVSGNVTLAGGVISEGPYPSGLASGSVYVPFNNDLTITSGTLYINNTGTKDIRLNVSGNFTATGGALVVDAVSLGQLNLLGASNSFSSNFSYANNFAMALGASGNQTLSGLPTNAGTLYLRGSGTKTISGSALPTVYFSTGSYNIVAALKLGSNLTNKSASAMLQTSSNGSGTLNLGVDANGYTYDMSAATAAGSATTGTGVWTPNAAAGSVTQTTWTLSSSATNGRIKAKGFDFTASKVSVLVGANLTLEACGAAANNLGSGTAFNSSSIFEYTGSASSTLTSSRDIGKLKVSSGALSVSGSFQAVSGVEVAGGTLIVGGTLGGNTTVANSATLTNNNTITGNVDVSGLMNGNGTVNGTLTIKTLGQLAPGNSPGTTTVNGGLVVDGGAKISMQIDKLTTSDIPTAGAAGNYDQIVVNGSVSLLENSILDFTSLNNTKIGDVFNLIVNDGNDAIQGTFSTVRINGADQTITNNSFNYNGLIYDLSYTGNADSGTNGNDLVLTVVPEPSTWAMVIGGIGLLTFSQRLRRHSALR